MCSVACLVIIYAVSDGTVILGDRDFYITPAHERSLYIRLEGVKRSVPRTNSERTAMDYKFKGEDVIGSIGGLSRVMVTDSTLTQCDIGRG